MGCDHRLSQAQAAIAGRHFAVSEYFKAAMLELSLQTN